MKLRKDLSIELSGNCLLILDKKNQKIHQLNETASIIWHWVEEGAQRNEICRKLAEQFEISDEEARRDVSSILENFVKLGLAVCN